MGIGTVILITFFTALIVGLIVAYIKKMFWFQKSSGRKYSTVYSDDTKKVKGACINTTDGTAGPAVTKSSECATACDAATTPPCLGYDWDGSSGCTLYATSPKTATKPTDETDKNECRALSK